MDKIIIIRYGELHLKGKNRIFFENTLIKNIKNKLCDIHCAMNFNRGRYIVSEFNEDSELEIIKLLKQVFGIHSISVAKKTKANFNDITALVLEMAPIKGSFRVNTNRADKKFPMTSVEVSCEIGSIVLNSNSALCVDLHNPDTTLNIDIRENGDAYVFNEAILCAGGMPVGTAGKGLLMLSGGIDSPVAGYYMAKRGLTLDAIHFHSYPYTSELAKEKVISLAKILKRYCGAINLICIPFTKIQEEIHAHCESSYMITLVRRCMFKISELVSQKRYCGCLVNGESLGQVASQTLESITVTNSVIMDIPVFRPLIGMDKNEIIKISTQIDTYQTSILPYEDCCTVFLPENPVTKPSIKRALIEEEKIPDLDGLILEAINNLEIIRI